MKKGFTLLEVVIALGVVALLLTSFLTVFGPATAAVQRGTSTDEAERLSESLNQSLQEYNVNDPTATPAGELSPFEIAFQNLSNIQTATSIGFLVFDYQANPASLDGRQMAPVTEAPAGEILRANDTFTHQTIVFDQSQATALARNYLEAAKNQVFLVQIKQLVYSNDGELMESDSTGGLTGMRPDGGGGYTVYASSSMPGGTGIYPEAVIAYQANFYLLPSNDPLYISRLTAEVVAEKLGSPVFSRNMAVLR